MSAMNSDELRARLAEERGRRLRPAIAAEFHAHGLLVSEESFIPAEPSREIRRLALEHYRSGAVARSSWPELKPLLDQLRRWARDAPDETVLLLHRSADVTGAIRVSGREVLKRAQVLWDPATDDLCVVTARAEDGLWAEWNRAASPPGFELTCWGSFLGAGTRDAGSDRSGSGLALPS